MLSVFLALACFQGNHVAVADLGFRMEMPPDWTVRPEPAPLAGFAELPPRKAMVMVTRSPATFGVPEEDTVKQYLDGMRQSLDRMEVIENEKVALSEGLPARKIGLTGWRGELVLRHQTYLLSGFGERLMVTFATEESRYAQLAPTFDSVASAIVFQGPAHYEHTLAFLKEILRKDVDHARLEALLKQGADINAPGPDQRTALMEAIFARRGPLVKWLLEHGADPDHPKNNMSFTTLAASPAIRELLRQRAGKPAKTYKSKPGGLEIEWTSVEAQLFAGIKSARIEYVREALAKGADLEALDRNYRLAPLPLVRRIIAEFQELELDASRYEPIESLLVKAHEGAGP
jgi:hypothetical protein